jgi:SAM-dependent methyltransferase
MTKSDLSLNFTGERFIPGLLGGIEAEHVHRYVLARMIANGCDVLDIACGEGYGSSILAEVARSVVGVDIADEAVNHAIEKYQEPNLRFLKGNCAQIPVVSASIDLVVSFETIEHHDQHEAMMLEIRRVLRPDGILLISSPNRPEYDKTLSELNEYHVKELDFDEFAYLLKNYFPQTRFYAQRVLSGSLLSPLGHTEAGFSNYSGSEEYYDGLSKPIYFLAVAGLRDLPTLGNSVYECSSTESDSKEIPVFLEARVYPTEFVDGVHHFGGEERSFGLVYELDAKEKSLELTLPLDLKLMSGLRLDVANGPAVIDLHNLSLHQENGELIWLWDGDCTSFINRAGVFCIKDVNGTTLFCVDGDPRFDLGIPIHLLEKVRRGAFLRLTLTPKRLLHELPRLIPKLLQQVMFEKAEADSKDHVHLNLVDASLSSNSFPTQSLQRKDQLLEQQQLFQMRKELLHAQAQLDLIKDLWLLDDGSLESL